MRHLRGFEVEKDRERQKIERVEKEGSIVREIEIARKSSMTKISLKR